MNTDDAAPLVVLAEVGICAGSWEPNVRLLGNVRAGDIVRAVNAITAAAPASAAEPIEAYYARQIEWSKNTFGPSLRTKGVCDHIRKELVEIEADPHDLNEWVDVIILAMDGFWRHGGSPDDLLPRLQSKQVKNFARKWPDWRGMSEDKAIEHDRSADALPIDT